MAGVGGTAFDARASGVPTWRPVRGGNAFEITVSRLVQAIKLGLVEVGDRLPPERELAEQLQVSRATLREAISALREAGYLSSRRGRTGGTFVVASDVRTGGSFMVAAGAHTAPNGTAAAPAATDPAVARAPVNRASVAAVAREMG